MTQDEIIEMPEYLNAAYEGDDLYTGDQVRKLMKLVAAKEHEWMIGYIRIHQPSCEQLANAIRVRGEA